MPKFSELYPDYWTLLESFNIPVETRRNNFRGKNLGSVFTDEQKEAIKNGTFKGLFLGDYWLISNRTFRVGDYNYWLNSGNTNRCTKNHLVIIPDRILYTASMNDENTTEGAYEGSKMRKENLEQAKEIIYSAFGEDYILTYEDYLTNGVANGHTNSGSWYDCTVELPDEVMMSGHYIFDPANDGTSTPKNKRYMVTNTQLALMRINPNFINPYNENQWLRNVTSDRYFSFVGRLGHFTYNDASVKNGVRPIFGLTGEKSN